MNEGDDSIDVALIQISGYRLQELKSKYSFLAGKYIGINHVFDERLYYMLFGFANKKTNREDIAFYVDSFGYLTNIRHFRRFENLGFSYRNSITLEYSRKQSDLDDEEDIPKMGFRDLKGLSGGGIWLSKELSNLLIILLMDYCVIGLLMLLARCQNMGHIYLKRLWELSQSPLILRGRLLIAMY